MSITTLQEIKNSTAPQEITLSGWNGNEVTFLLKKPNFYHLLAKNAVPNPLIPEVQKVLSLQRSERDFAHPTGDYARALALIARECLVTPSYAELEEESIELTDMQLLEISVFAAAGVNAIKTFRSRTRAAAGGYVENIPQTAERSLAPDRPDDGLVRGRGNHVLDDAVGKGNQAPPGQDRE